ncbi:MAG: alpha/beta hydrolase [Chloroflexota bacterium]
MPELGTAPAELAPDPGTRRDIEVTVGEAPWRLPGTLSLPAADRPGPAAVIVHGSGPHDRDGTIGPNTPYRDLAEGLVAAGIAVLRYDKRTLARRAELAPLAATLTVEEEVVDDALAAVALLRATPAVDPGAVFVLGHSLGGYLAPRIAARAGDAVRGIAILAGNSRGLAEVMLDQTETLASAGGAPTPEAAAALDALRGQVARLSSPELGPDTPASELPFGVPASYWLDLRAYDPISTAAALHRPILVLAGGRDYQVTRIDFDGWRTGLAGVEGVTFDWQPRLSHLFIEGDAAPSPPTTPSLDTSLRQSSPPSPSGCGVASCADPHAGASSPPCPPAVNFTKGALEWKRPAPPRGGAGRSVSSPAGSARRERVTVPGPVRPPRPRHQPRCGGRSPDRRGGRSSRPSAGRRAAALPARLQRTGVVDGSDRPRRLHGVQAGTVGHAPSGHGRSCFGPRCHGRGGLDHAVRPVRRYDLRAGRVRRGGRGHAPDRRCGRHGRALSQRPEPDAGRLSEAWTLALSSCGSAGPRAITRGCGRQPPPITRPLEVIE